MAIEGMVFKFDEPKAIEAILYLANRISESCKYNICKMLYLADKQCLGKYGRFIFGESYTAMKEGTTPSKAYDLLKRIAKEPIDDLRVEGNDVIPLRDANLEYLSESDIECLDQTIATYDKEIGKMRIDAHDAAWEKAWRSRGVKRSAAIPIQSIAKTLADSDELMEYLTNHGA